MRRNINSLIDHGFSNADLIFAMDAGLSFGLPPRVTLRTI